MEQELRARLIAYVRRRYPGADPEDVVSEAVAQLYASAAFSPDKVNFGYLARACDSFALKRKNSPAEASLPETLSGGEDPADALIRTENSRELRAVLQSLPENQRLVLDEHYFGEKSFREIAKTHGLNQNTVLSHHKRGLERARRMMEVAEENSPKNPLPPREIKHFRWNKNF